MDDTKDKDTKQLKQCEVELEDARNLSSAREKLLLANLRELEEVHHVLSEKIGQIKERDARIRSFDEILTRANRLSSLGELAASIAHEIKNPLVSIEGFAKRIGRAKDAEKVHQYAQFIEREADRLSKVLTRLLDFSRMSEPVREPLDLNETVDDTILFLEHHLTRFRNIDLTVRKGRRLPQVHADKIHVQQALINIVMNAAQAMSEGGPLVIETGTDRKRYAWIAVTDKGPGMDQETLKHIFEPFFTTKPKGQGTGLGLPLSKRLIEANSGEIEVKSAVGEGTTFRLLLPFAKPSETNKTNEA
jgi:two-component system NtrC family sensor kinase